MVGINLGVDISTFPARIDQRRIQLKKGLNLLNQNVVREVVKKVVRATPVDQGIARSNWNVSRGTPNPAVRGAYFPLPKFTNPGKLRERKNATAAVAAAESTILQFRPGDQEGSVLWISNHTPYIGDLDSGSSVQADQDFVEKAVREGVRVGFRRSKGFLFAKGRLVSARKAVEKFS